MERLKNIVDTVIDGDDDATTVAVRQALDRGVAPLEIINQGLVAGLDVVGQRFQTGEMFVPEMILAANAARAGIEIATQGLRPGKFKTKATMVLGTVKGDVHDIGKNLVALVLESRGFKIINLGVDVREVEFVDAIREHRPQFLGMSALLTTTMANMKDVVAALNRSGVRNNVRIVIGGAPVSASFASEIGADGYARNVVEAANLIESLLVKTNG